MEADRSREKDSWAKARYRDVDGVGEWRWMKAAAVFV